MYHRAQLSGSGNYRNKLFNTFGTGGLGDGQGFNNMDFYTILNAIVQEETVRQHNDWNHHNYRVGTDFFLGKKHTLGFLLSGAASQRANVGLDRITLARQATPGLIDSILVATTIGDNRRSQQTYNLNYRFDNTKGRSLNVDLD